MDRRHSPWRLPLGAYSARPPKQRPATSPSVDKRISHFAAVGAEGLDKASFACLEAPPRQRVMAQSPPCQASSVSLSFGRDALEAAADLGGRDAAEIEKFLAKYSSVRVAEHLLAVAVVAAHASARPER
eukprot:1291743-Pyramimonas_sp.AAC.1